MQPTLFNDRQAAPKQVQDTSLEAFAEVSANLGERQLTVLKALAAYHGRESAWPTAYELLEWMRQWRPQLDLNSIRPRVTELRNLRFVEADGKRKCSVTGKTAYVWMVTERGRLYLRGLCLRNRRCPKEIPCALKSRVTD